MPPLTLAAFTADDTGRLVVAIVALLICAHGLGYLFRHYRQPPVIGEILGGLLLGPTLLGALAPSVYLGMFVDHAATATVLGALYQFGLLLLMFCSGCEMRAIFPRSERKLVGLITLTGALAPFLFGVLVMPLVNVEAQIGTARHETAFLLVFGIAIAVTSIPVISRILFDLGLMDTPFARIVVSAAVIEDVILYVVLAIALSMAGGATDHGQGLPALLGLKADSALGLAYHTFVTLAFFGLAVALGPVILRWADSFRYNLLRRSSPVAHLLIFLLIMTALSAFLGVATMFGAFAAGVAASQSPDARGEPQAAIKSFSFAFFIPIYFAIVGLKLDLIRSFDPLFFAAFLAFACVAKALSVYAGARLARESHFGAINIAVAMNARGGPGIVLASVALDAHIINESFYATLVLLAILTSLAAGSWLDMVVRRHWPLR